MTRLALLFPLASLALLAALPSRAGDVKLDKHDGSIDVSIDGKPFTTYHFDEPSDKLFARPYMYPVFAADGTPITSDQVITEKGKAKPEHIHHRSFYVAHGDVDGADHWSLEHLKKGEPQPRQHHVSFDKSDGDTIVENLQWDAKDCKSILLDEKRTIRFFTFDDGSRGVDLTVALTPAHDQPVTLKSTKEAGLCAVRVAKEISAKPTLTNSAGQGGEGKKGEDQTWGKPATWCDISGMVNGKPYGIAILDHPTNPKSPTQWHVRAYGLMSANPWGLHDYNPKLPKDAGDMKLEPGKATTFRYRVVFHEGDAKSAKLDEKEAAFAGK